MTQWRYKSKHLSACGAHIKQYDPTPHLLRYFHRSKVWRI
jgi:hypothetical protein